ncbi:MAG: NmrA family NAD(P)-binding protein [Deltaproteobacteria bacterium]|nr:MAG: NmrA family NAD(P)-binding protein [Deltaproteobacteria bacterium]
MYVITGANGNVGRRLAEILLAEGKKVRVVSRNVDRLQPLAHRGAEVCMGSLQDEAFLAQTFRGARAAYVMIPPNHQAENLRAYQNRVGNVIFNVLKNAGVDYIVNLSSLGAHRPDKTGPVLGLYDQEQRLNWLEKANLVHLRPTFFMENLLSNVHLIKTRGINGTPLRGDLALPMVATKDIARVASEYLLELGFKGIVVRELLGQRNISMNEMTQILGKAIGLNNLQYVQFSFEEAESSMIEAGFSRDVAQSLLQLYGSINERIVIVGTERTDENTTETPFEEFAESFAAAYGAG